MRTLLLGAAFVLATPAFACPMADAAAFQAAADTVQTAQGAKIVLSVEGMHCGSCAQKITAKLSALPGVTAVAVDHQTGSAQVAYDPSKVKPEALVEAVKAAGYKASLPST